MRLSVVIPAYNEAALVGACIDGASAAMAGLLPGGGWEIVVCDNNSSDATAAEAAAHGARVVREPVNQIARARNAGAAAASGDWLLFMDADSSPSAVTVGKALELMAGGRCCGGSALIAFEPRPPWWGAALTGGWNLLSRVLGLGAGSFFFCRRDAFAAVGGFSPGLYAGEELELTRALKRWGAPRGLKFEVITSARHVSSGRKFRLYSFRELAMQSLVFCLRPARSLRDPARLKVFYEGRR